MLKKTKTKDRAPEVLAYVPLSLSPPKYSQPQSTSPSTSAIGQYTHAANNHAADNLKKAIMLFIG
jgi:hypothetical protein